MKKKIITTGISYETETGEVKSLVLSRNEVAIVDGVWLTNSVLAKEEIEDLKKALGEGIGSIFCYVE